MAFVAFAGGFWLMTLASIMQVVVRVYAAPWFGLKELVLTW